MSRTYLRAMLPEANAQSKLIREWAVPAAATFGSSVRSRGILLELLAQLPSATKKSLGIKSGVVTLTMPGDSEMDFQSLSQIISRALKDIETLPVIPREIEDILDISATERHRWLKDGRLKSAGTRTVRLRGRARQVTFHVFDPRYVEELLDREVVAGWREEDAIKAAKNRQWAAERRGQRRLDVSAKPPTAGDESPEEAARFELKGWADFERDFMPR